MYILVTLATTQSQLMIL